MSRKNLGFEKLKKDLTPKEIFKNEPETIFKLNNPILYFFILGIIVFFISLNTSINKSLFFFIFNISTKHYLFLNPIMEFSAFLLFAVICIIAFFWTLLNEKKKMYTIGFSFLFIGILAFIISRIVMHFYFDIRPYMEYGLKPLVPVSSGNGFPSDHALLTSAVTATMYLYSRKAGLILLILTILVCIARIFVAAHHPLDVAASIFIVFIATSIYLLFYNKIGKKLL